jgi:hypothetical protein
MGWRCSLPRGDDERLHRFRGLPIFGFRSEFTCLTAAEIVKPVLPDWKFRLSFAVCTADGRAPSRSPVSSEPSEGGCEFRFC